MAYLLIALVFAGMIAWIVVHNRRKRERRRTRRYFDIDDRTGR
ncbi:hypothetical protein [Flavisphingopyxis soli]|nr:hypothetical protein [Sphingorhabdus soli]